MTTHWLDRVTAPIAPRWTLRRMRARMTGDLLARHYEAASGGRRTAGWKRSMSDANAAIGPGLSKLRESARDLVRNNPYAESALATIVDHAIGWGITPKPAPRSIEALAAWKRWAESTDCDADGRHDFAGLEKLVMRTVVESGECLVRRRIRFPSDGFFLPMQIQVLEPDFLDTSKDFITLPNGGRIIQGVEFDAIGRRAAYWLFKEHPGSSNPTGLPASTRVPSDGVLHIFRGQRPGQVRAASWFAPVLLRFKDFDDFEDATLMKQKIAACLAVITSDVDGSAPALGSVDPAKPDWDSLEPGAIINAPPGRTIEVVQPPTVREYADYVATSLRGIAAGIGVTYEDLTGDYCMAPETRVLRGDLRWVRADELHEGDSLVAFDEERPEGQGQRRKWRQTTVVRSGRRDLPRVKVVTDKATVTVSSEHMFLCIGTKNLIKSSNGYGHVWVRADQLKPGQKIAFLCEPWADGTSHTHGYLKGIADGEGWIDRNRAHIGIAQKPGVVCDEIGTALKAAGFSPRLRPANGQNSADQWELFGTAECLRFLGEVRPIRLLQSSAAIYDGKAMSGGMGKKGQQTHAVVLSAEAEGVGPVVTLSTGTHTVITEGLCSHNTDLPYSAARMSRLRHWARVDDWRWRLMIPQFCDPVWNWVGQVAAIANIGGLRTRPMAEWTAPPMAMIEPDKEGLAYQRNIRSGIMTLSEAIRERGYDPEDMLAELADDFSKLDKLKLILDIDPRHMTQAGQMQALPAAEPAKPALSPARPAA